MDDARQGEDHADDSQQVRAPFRCETAVEMAGRVAGGQVEEDLHYGGQSEDPKSHHGHAGELADVPSEAVPVCITSIR
jgi:hypothetical protein